ncbi:conserved hypothetical Ustilaginaceae-specific protein [Sporisorium reilianum SRZ2]|uniref:Uncharacterized protein n=2 Tax=Sporisorium reilianum TaxID=72558 RepID=A0A2N8UEP6_9BASI|nr:conserved hypothetical Ustilaginaceae-specific protein [Sporisorium reilianum SRZ2]SJX63436.1 uncharacterized protein SRS1_11101 [Sporisorium reilianum f. sp. reilianum]
MKLLTLSLALTTLVAAASTTAAAECDKPVAWDQVANKDATLWAFYSQPQGTDLRTVKPKYHECSVTNPAGKDSVFATFEGNKDFEFQPVQDGVLGANCIDCTPQMLGNYYLVKIDAYIECKMYEDTPIE